VFTNITRRTSSQHNPSLDEEGSCSTSSESKETDSKPKAKISNAPGTPAETSTAFCSSPQIVLKWKILSKCTHQEPTRNWLQQGQ